MSDIENLLEMYFIVPNYLLNSYKDKTEKEKRKKKLEDTCLRSNEHWDLFFNNEFDADKLKDTFESLPDEQRTKIFKFGVTCFIRFVQANFTGPTLEKQTEDYLMLEKFSKLSCEKILSFQNEEINVNTKHPVLLLSALIIFQWCNVNNIVNYWWYWRAILIHQDILDDLCPMLLSDADRLYKLIEDNGDLEAGPIKALLNIEMAQLYLLYQTLPKAKEHVSSAKSILGVQYELIGVLGKRTRFQEKDLPQLSIKVKVEPADPTISRPEVEDKDVPEDVKLNDDVRLDKIEFSEKMEENPVMTNLEQKLFLTIVQEMLVSKPQDELQVEELQPLINYILNQKNSYSVRVVALLLRCKFESKERRTIERSLLQCEEIVKSWKKETPSDLDRVLDVFGTGMPPMWKVEAQYGDLLLNIGLVKSALEVYLKIKLWEEVIVCYTILQLRHKATEVIKEQLNLKPTVKLWCLLGDATDDTSCYEKAWEMSKRRSHRAQRHWGQYYFSRKQYDKCISHYEKSVSINPLQSNVWSRLGFAALQTGSYHVAATAYRRYTTLEPDGFEGWNNLAQAYIKIGNNRTAHQALLEALKCNFENWKVWENLLVVSCDIAHFSDVIRSYHKVLDLKERYLNIDVLNILVYNVCNDMTDCEGQPTKRFLQKTRELIGRVTAIFPNEGFIWELYANLAPSVVLRAQRLQRAYRGYTQGSWDKTPASCQQVLFVCNKLAELVLTDEVDPRDTILNSARLTLSSAVAAVKKRDWVETRDLVVQISAYLDRILEKISLLETSVKVPEPSEL